MIAISINYREDFLMKKIIKNALKFCSKSNVRLTEPRLEVLKIISNSEKPIKAYEVLDKLASKMKNPKPPTAYRAIEFWMKHNFIHRIESLNAYLACEENHLHKGSQFLICESCGKVIESHICELPEAFKKSTRKNTFIPSTWNLEINGICNLCT